MTAMFAATITLTINAVAKVLNRVNQDGYGSEYAYKSATEQIVMKIRHGKDKVPTASGGTMNRHNVYVEWTIFATPTAYVQTYTYTATMREGAVDDPAKVADLLLALNVWLASGTIADDLAVGIN